MICIDCKKDIKRGEDIAKSYNTGFCRCEKCYDKELYGKPKKYSKFTISALKKQEMI